MKMFSRILTACLFCALLGGAAFAQSKTGTIDLRKVFDNYWRTKQADATLKDQAADMEKDHKGFVEDWNKAKAEYQKLLESANDQAISVEEREKRKKSAETKLLDIKELEQTIAQYERQARTTLDEKRKRMRDNILVEIRNVINAKAKASNYAFVIDTAADSANNTPIVLYSTGDNDLTEAILTQLNANAPAETPKAEEKKDEPKKEEPKKEEKK